MLTAVPGGYLTVAEVEVFAKVPGVSAESRLAAITVDGKPLRGFSREVTDYRVRGGRHAVVAATPADPYATVTTSGGRRSRTITVTSEDRSMTTTYRLHFR